MKYKHVCDIPYPKTTAEAIEAYDELLKHFGNGEELCFETAYRSREDVEMLRISADLLNGTIEMFQYYWCDDSGHDRAVDCFKCIHMDVDRATNVADAINYFVKIIKQKGGEQ